MSRSHAEYQREWKKRKKEGNFVDRRFKPKPDIKDRCLNCDSELPTRFKTKRPRKFCGNNKCQHDYARKVAIEKGLAGIGSTKRHLIETRGYKCECCENSQWMNKPIPLDLDHCNGDFNDNSLSNVRLLCPNCHAQTPTYKIKNRGKGRLRNTYMSKPFYLSKINHQNDLTT